MGAQLSTVAPTATVPIDAYIAELGDLTFSGDLGRSRFLKTVKAVHRDGVASVKVFIKPTTAQIDIGPVKAQVKTISENLRKDLGPLNEFPNAIGYSRIVETERAGYLVRQYIKHSLYDRISTRPFLEPIEKKWIAYQLLHALKSCHEHNIYHGDIKSENVLVGSWKWIYLADFAPFKPVKLPETDSAQFLFYFDVSQRRACYVAPERFSESGPDVLNAKMDVYSAGCVIAELFLDGQPLFSLADLFKYKRGEYTPDLSSIGDSHVQDLILSMVSVDPESRLDADEYLQKYHNMIFPESFDAYWNLLVPYSGSAGATSSDDMVKHLWTNFEPQILRKAWKLYDLKSVGSDELSTTNLTVAVTLPGIWLIPRRRDKGDLPEDSGALIILSFVCSALTSTSSVDWRLRAAKLILVLAEFVPDDAKLDRCLPYLVYLLRDSQPVVRSNALILITHLMTMVKDYTPLNEKVFTGYLFPRISQAVNYDALAIMRAVYAECLPRLAQAAVDCEGWDAVIPFVENATRLLLVDKVGIVRRSLLNSADVLCTVLKKQGTNDIILSHAITYLNDKDPQVRIDLFRFIAKVSPLVGPISIEQYVVPLLVQSLCEPREDIVALVVQSLAAIVEVGLLRLKTLLGVVVPCCVKFLIHPNIYLRTQTLLLMAATAKQLSKSQVYCLLRPILAPYISSDVKDCQNHNSLIEALRPPISQSVYTLALQWASKAKKSAFWQPNTSSPGATITFSQEDRRWLSRLREVGFNNEDLWQLLAFREHLWQLSLMAPASLATGPQPSELDPADVDAEVVETITEAPNSTVHTRLSSKNGLATYSGGPIPSGLEVYVRTKLAEKKSQTASKYIYVGNTKIATLDASAAQKRGTAAALWNGDPNSADLRFAAGAALGAIPKADQFNDGSKSKPSVLVTSIKAHRGAIKVLAAHPNNRIFITAADDGVVKLWDSRILLKGSSRPVSVWSADNPVTAGSFLADTPILIIGTQDGKSTFLDCKTQINDGGSLVFEGFKEIAHLKADDGYPIAYHTFALKNDLWVLQSDGALQKIDLSTLTVAESLECPREHGAPTSWAWSPYGDWVVVGTLHGMIELFDTRFGLHVNSWGVGDMQPITALASHPLRSHCFCVAGGFRRNLISVWDAQKVECSELLVPLSDLDEDDDNDEDEDHLPPLDAVPGTLQSLPEKFASWSLNDTFARSRPPVTSLAASKVGGNHLLTGGGDRILRYWDVRTSHESKVISGLSQNNMAVNYTGKVGTSVKHTYEVSTPLKTAGRLSRGAIIGREERDISRNHRGTITQVALLELGSGRDLAVSVDEVGVIKVFS